MKNHYKEILQAALKSEKKDFIAIDECKQFSSRLSAVAQLAKEGNSQATEFLLKRSANLNKVGYGAALGRQRNMAESLRKSRGVSINWLALGTAEADDRQYAEFLRLRCGASVDWLARGAAANSDRRYAEFLRSHCQANVSWLARGAAEGKNDEYAEYLRKEHKANVHWIAHAAATVGNQKYAEKLRLTCQAKVNYIARGAAAGGFFEYVTILVKGHGADLNWVIEGAGIGGHWDYLETMLKKEGLSQKAIDRCIYGLALGGHRACVEKLRTEFHANVNTAAQGMAVTGNFTYLATLLANVELNLRLIANSIIRSRHFSSIKLQLYTLSFINNESTREKLISALAGNVSPIIKEPNKVSKLTRQLNLLIRQSGLNYDQARFRVSDKTRLLFLINFLIIDKGAPIRQLPSEILLMIWNFTSPFSISLEELNDLRFKTLSDFLKINIEAYVSKRKWGTFHKEEAQLFLTSVAEVSNEETLAKRVKQEHNKLKRDSKQDNYSRIIGLFHYRLSGEYEKSIESPAPKKNPTCLIS